MPRQNGRRFTDDILMGIFLNEKVWIPINISLNIVPKDAINNIPVLVQIMVGTVQATSYYLNQWWLVYWSINASLGLNELSTTRVKVCDTLLSHYMRLMILYFYYRFVRWISPNNYKVAMH